MLFGLEMNGLNLAGRLAELQDTCHRKKDRQLKTVGRDAIAIPQSRCERRRCEAAGFFP